MGEGGDVAGSKATREAGKYTPHREEAQVIPKSQPGCLCPCFQNPSQAEEDTLTSGLRRNSGSGPRAAGREGPGATKPLLSRRDAHPIFDFPAHFSEQQPLGAERPAGQQGHPPVSRRAQPPRPLHCFPPVPGRGRKSPAAALPRRNTLPMTTRAREASQHPPLHGPTPPGRRARASAHPHFCQWKTKVPSLQRKFPD